MFSKSLILINYDQAIKHFTKAIELNPIDIGSYLQSGMCKSSIKDYKGAITDFTKIIAIENSNDEAYYNSGLAKGDLGEVNDAADSVI